MIMINEKGMNDPIETIPDTILFYLYKKGYKSLNFIVHPKISPPPSQWIFVSMTKKIFHKLSFIVGLHFAEV